jgi:nicotinamidase/pyrazinamidase
MKTAFFCVDLQQDFVRSGGALYVKGAEQLIPTFQEITRTAMSFDIPVIASMDLHLQNDREFTIFPPHCIALTHGAELIREVCMGVEEGKSPRHIPDVIITKQTYDVFSNPLTEKIIKAVGAKKWCVYGVATDYCVRAAVLGLRKMRCRVDVFADAIMGVAKDTTEKAIAEMRTAGANFVSSKNFEALK